MRDFIRVLGVACGLALAACGSDLNAKVACSSDSDCIKGAAKLVDFDASVAALPQCCNTVCVFPASGCDSGYRYLTAAPAVGDCAAAPMCVAKPDLSMEETVDMADTD